MLLRHERFRRLCRARDLLCEIPDEPASIEAVARSVGISPWHFIRQFEAVFGATPHQFRMRARLELARRLLATGEHSVTDTCMAVGFSSVGSFSSLFARRFGESPSAYRRRARTIMLVPGLPSRVLFPGCLTLMALLPPPQFSRSIARR